ncbi:MAG: excinuclease ABC subunit UvrC [Candidatus Latescibacteria bacterium]|jgi:excinuclease ABC subunit C|nr:excinuclease ABC subunit UvrC [Candidatus Latescibacterota bacterium]
MTTFHKLLREKAEILPDNPGVYMWLNSDGEIIYVGKAKNLRSRVLSYFREDGDGRPQVPWLMSQAADLDFIVTGSEIEALVTEANLARAKQPKYNVRLKDDKRYPYIKITREAVPRIFLTRTIRDDGARYLGPYTDVKAVRRTLKIVHTIFPIRLCRQKLPSKKIERACLNYQIKRCSGPCMGYISLDDYRRYIEDAYHFIQGHNNEVIRNLKVRMKTASHALEFERAAELRDRIEAIRKISERSKAFSTARLTGEWDVVNYYVIDKEACVVIMEIREGNILGKKDYMMSGVQYTSTPEMSAAFLTQYYLRASWIPPEIHLTTAPEDTENIRTLLSEHRNGGVEFVYPKRGEKARLLRMTAMNAELILRETIEKRDRARDAVAGVILALKRDLKLKKPPRTIACIDISHLMGTDTVASLVFFNNGKPEKREYRHFKIKTVDYIDDFMSMREVVERYFARRIEEKKELPDLLLVDGGKGQLSSALKVLNRLGLQKQPVAALAKRLEEVFLPGAPDAQNIPKTSSSLHLLQRIRDEAHRFAITYQQKLRQKRTISSSLTRISGVGTVMTQALIKYFGSVTAVKKASVQEIAETPGIGMKRAQIIYDELLNK